MLLKGRHKNSRFAGQWWHTLLIPALGRQRVPPCLVISGVRLMVQLLRVRLTAKRKKFIYVYVCVYMSCMYWCPWRLEECIRSSGAGVTGNCEMGMLRTEPQSSRRGRSTLPGWTVLTFQPPFFSNFHGWNTGRSNTYLTILFLKEGLIYLQILWLIATKGVCLAFPCTVSICLVLFRPLNHLSISVSSWESVSSNKVLWAPPNSGVNFILSPNRNRV